MGEGPELLLCIPVFNDWAAVTKLIALLDDVLAGMQRRAHVLLVDDGSTERPPAKWPTPLKHIGRVEVLPLRRNLGHQRAIALGLTFIYEHRPCDAVVVMDADGEDAPKHVADLVAALDRVAGKQCVFAKRARRSEGMGFRAGYHTYRLIHRILTGRKVEVGNFSVVPWGQLERLVGVSEIWNHYAAAVYKARLPVTLVPVPRATRLDGQSKMNFVSLVTHGLSAISVYGEVVGVRLLVLSAVLMGFTTLGIGGILGVRFGTDLAIPGWATNAAGLLAIMFTTLFLVLTLSVLFVLQSRDRYSFLPLRDYRHYLLDPLSLHG